MPTPRAIALAGLSSRTAAPRTWMVPASGRSMPYAMRMSVDFPAPFSPTKACTVPERTRREADTSACVAPNRLSMPSSASADCSSLLEGSVMVRGSETGRCRDEAPRNAEGTFDLRAERTHTERLRGVMSDVEHRDTELRCFDGGVVRSLADDERIDPGGRCFTERVAGRTGAGAQRPAKRAPLRRHSDRHELSALAACQCVAA